MKTDEIVEFLKKTGSDSGQNANDIMSALSKNPHNSEIRDAYVNNVSVSNMAVVLTGVFAAHNPSAIIDNLISLAESVKKMHNDGVFGDVIEVDDTPNE